MSTLSVSQKLAQALISLRIGTGPSHTDAEIQNVWELFFDSVKPFYPAEFEALEREYTPRAAGQLINKVVSDIALKFFSFTFNNRDQLPPMFQPFLEHANNFVQAGRMPSLEELEPMQPKLKDFEREYLAHKTQETGIRASSFKELFEKQSIAECRGFIDSLPEQFTVDDFLNVLLRKGLHGTFFQILREDVQHYQNTGEKKKSLYIFDRLIENYIAPQPSRVWRMRPENNYTYYFPSIEHLLNPRVPEEEREFLFKRLQQAQEFISLLEDILDGFQQMKSLLKSFRDNLPWIIFAESEAIFKFAKQTQVNPPKTDPRLHAALSGYLLPILIRVSGPSKKSEFFVRIIKLLPIHVKLFLYLERPPTLKQLSLDLTEVQQKILAEVTELFDASLDDTLEKAELLREARNPQKKQKGLPILGVGFSGATYERFPADKRDKIFLNFTGAYRSTESSVSGLPILNAIKVYLEYSHSASDLPLPYKIHVLDSIEQEENDVLQYTANYVIDKICEQPSRLHPDLKASYQRALVDRLQSDIRRFESQIKANRDKLAKQPQSARQLQDAYAKLQQQLDNSAYLLNLIQEDDWELFTEEHKEYLKSLVKTGEKRICIETVISQFSGNAYTLSFAMGSEVGEPVLFKGGPYIFGFRTLVQPCLTRCQLMGIAHTLWGELHQLPTLQQADERDKSRGGKGVTPLIDRHVVEGLRSDIQSAVDLFRNSPVGSVILPPKPKQQLIKPSYTLVVNGTPEKPVVELKITGEFSYCGAQYQRLKTKRDGFCAVHALLGHPNVEGTLEANETKKEIADLFRTEWKKQGESTFKEHLRHFFSALYDDFDRGNSEYDNPLKKLLILPLTQLRADLQESQEREEAFDQQLKARRLSILQPYVSLIEQDEDLKSSFQQFYQDGAKVIDLATAVAQNADRILLWLKQRQSNPALEECYQNLLRLELQRDQLQQARKQLLDTFVNDLLETYLKRFQESEYFLTVLELDLVAQLKGKRVWVLNQQQIIGDGSPPEENMMIIWHEGAHFERCRKV